MNYLYNLNILKNINTCPFHKMDEPKGVPSEPSKPKKSVLKLYPLVYKIIGNNPPASPLKSSSSSLLSELKKHNDKVLESRSRVQESAADILNQMSQLDKSF